MRRVRRRGRARRRGGVDELWGQRVVGVAHRDAVDGAPDVAVGSDVERDAGADAELVALRIGHRNPDNVGALADIDPPSTQLLEPRDLAGDVGDAQVEVDAHLPCLGSGTRCRITGGYARSAGNSRQYGSPNPTTR